MQPFLEKHIQSITAAALPAFRTPKATNSFLHIYIKKSGLNCIFFTLCKTRNYFHILSETRTTLSHFQAAIFNSVFLFQNFFLIRNKQKAFGFKTTNEQKSEESFKHLQKYFHQEAQSRFELLKKKNQNKTKNLPPNK